MINADLEKAGYSEEYLINLNSVLENPHVTPMGAYCIGVVELIIRNSLGSLPPRTLIALSANCSSVMEAVSMAERWIQMVTEASNSARG